MSHLWRKLTMVTAMLVLISMATATFAQIQTQKKTTWQKVKGKAVQIAIGANDVTAAIHPSGKIYQFDHSNHTWRPIGGAMSRLAVDNKGVIWAVDRTGRLRFYTGTSWQSVGSGAFDVAAARDGMIYVTTNRQTIAQYNPTTKAWSAIKGNAKYLTIDANNHLWRVTEKGDIARLLDEAWIGVIGKAVDIDADADGDIVILGQDQKLYQWQSKTASWVAMPQTEQTVALASGAGQIWRIHQDGKLYAYGLGQKLRNKDTNIAGSKGGGSTDASEVVDTSPIIFERLPVRTAFSDLAIGRDGSVYGVTTSGELERWSNTERRFNEFPGKVDRLTIRENGLPLAIGTKGSLVEHDGEAWRLINLNLSLLDLALYDDDKVLVLNTKENVATLNDTLTSFSLLPKQGQQIAATTDGAFWVVDGNKRVFKCNPQAQCQQKNVQANDIAIGPAGTVFVVDRFSSLQRYNPKSDMFELIRQGNTSRVAIGPQDRPWILDLKGQTFASKFFERDESKDRILAQKTSATEKVTEQQANNGGNTGIEITAALSFTTATVPTSAPGYPDLSGDLLDLTSGADDIVIVTGFDNPCVAGEGLNWIYNPAANTFSHLDYLKRINLTGGVAASDLAVGFVNGSKPSSLIVPSVDSFFGSWFRTCSTPEMITYVASVFTDPSVEVTQNFNAAILTTPPGPGTDVDIDIAADGTIGNINQEAKLELFHPTDSDDIHEYEQITFMRFGIGKDEDDLWAVNDSYNVYQLIPSTNSFKLRSINPDDRAMDVGVGTDGTVFIVNLSGVLKKWDPVGQRFVRTNKTGVNRVAVDSRGNPIVANFPDSNVIYFGR